MGNNANASNYTEPAPNYPPGLGYAELSQKFDIKNESFRQANQPNVGPGRVDREEPEVQIMYPSAPMNFGLLNDAYYQRLYPSYQFGPTQQGDVSRETNEKGSTAFPYQSTFWRDPLSDNPKSYTGRIPPATAYMSTLGATNDTNDGVPPSLFLYHSISAMIPYSAMSPEELRFLDMKNGVPRPQVSSATQHPAQRMAQIKPAKDSYAVLPSSSGQPLSTQLTEPFQAAIRQQLGIPDPATAVANTGLGGFGSTTANNNAFGSTTGGFGSTNNAFGAGANTNLGFGQTQNQQQPQSNMFGASSTANKPFGQTATTGFGSNTGAFGSTGQTNAFGSNNATTGAFGAPKTTFGAATNAFGSTSTNTGAFGQPAAQTNNAFGFGSNNNQQQGQQPQQNAFGLGSTGAFGMY